MFNYFTDRCSVFQRTLQEDIVLVSIIFVANSTLKSDLQRINVDNLLVQNFDANLMQFSDKFFLMQGSVEQFLLLKKLNLK